MSSLNITGSRMRRGLLLSLILIFSAALLLAGCASTSNVSTSGSLGYTAATSSSTQSTPLFDEDTVISLYDKCIPAVVQIERVIEAPLSQLPGPFSLKIPNRIGEGSGFFIDEQGHILTNYHVVEDSSSIKVMLDDGTEIDGKVIGSDRYNDIALLQVDASKIPNIVYLALADSDQVRPGQMAVALGSPFRLQGSITVGVVSGTGRSLPGVTDRTITGIIQTDAAINPGNSGGPLLNSRGEVIGINTAIEASANGVGFAVPINTAKSRMTQLLKGGAIKTPWLGIQGTAASKDLAEKLNLSAEKGVYVVSVLPDSPADKAGLVAGGVDDMNDPKAGGDLLTAIDGIQLTGVPDLLSYLNNKAPGDKVTLTVQRGGETISVTVELEAWPDKLPGLSESIPIPGEDGLKFDFGPFNFRIK
ncbi:MAG: trypsin-like peptidase domain-containing protein [Dehalococcoidia bacterium]|nr:trypsin-like peptidase domain-containing protein [Dehalococcoidia bacterium]